MSASSALITDMTTAVTTGPNATSKALAIAAAGPIQSIEGNLVLVQMKLQEAKVLLDQIDVVVDSGDPIQTQITNVLAALV